MKPLVVVVSACLLMFSGCCAPCGPCGGPVCGPPTLFPHLVNNMRCASGCGDFYLGEWHADPPCCDPCNHCGDYIGPVSCCKPTLRELWGIRYDACCDTGCDSCGHGHHHTGYDEHWVEGGGHWQDGYYDAPVVPRSSVEEIVPTPATPMPSAAPPTPEPSASDPGLPPAPMTDPPMSDPSMPEPSPPAGSLDEVAPPAPMQTIRGGYRRPAPFARTRRTRR